MRKSRALRKESRRKKHIPTVVEQKPMSETPPVVEQVLPVAPEQPAPSRAQEAVERPVQKTSIQAQGEKYKRLLETVCGGGEIDVPEFLECCEEQLIFLTGLAGSGKSAALKRWVSKTRRKVVVCAPTGVAALLCGGTTIHRAFSLPITIMDEEAIQECAMKQRRYVKYAQTLIIDEASMVSSHMIDVLSRVLQIARGNRRLPFGGMQVVFIGDLWQLPPVVRDEEWSIINRDKIYESHFFFGSKAFKESPPLVLNLTKLFRQNEQESEFIDILNSVRCGKIGDEQLERLNSRVRPEFGNVPGYVYIAATNREVDSINKKHLESLPGPSEIYQSVIEGDFNSKDAPCDSPLVLRIGAQVMITANEQRPKGDKPEDDEDDTWQPSYVNGTVGEVSAMNPGSVQVKTEAGTFTLCQRTWEKVKYEVVEDSIKAIPTGSMSQFPLRLAAAITAHKVQGQTLDKAIVDSGSIFEVGQLYVALSRCRTLNNLVLKRAVTRNAVMAAPGVAGWFESLGEKGRILNVRQEFIGNPNAITKAAKKDLSQEIVDSLVAGEYLTDEQIAYVKSLSMGASSMIASVGLSVFLDEIESLRAIVKDLQKRPAKRAKKLFELA